MPSLGPWCIYCKWKNIKRSYRNNKRKISAPKWDDKCELFDGSYSVSDIQGYFNSKVIIIEKHELLLYHKTKTLTYNPPIRIYENKTENRITFEIKTGYFILNF